jgi:hypothetical protein
MMDKSKENKNKLTEGVTYNNSINTSLPFKQEFGGTGLSSPAPHGILITGEDSQMTPLVLTDGQVLIGQTGFDPIGATLTAGDGIGIESTAGEIVISSTIPAFEWQVVSGASHTLAPNIGCVSTNASLATFTLPATANLGDSYKVVAYTAGGWKIAPGTDTQLIRFGNAVTTVDTGYIASTSIGDSAELFCVDDSVHGSEVFMIVNAITRDFAIA